MSKTENFLIIDEDGTLTPTNEIDEQDIKSIKEEIIQVVAFRHDSWWVAYVDENGQLCFEEIVND